MHNNIRHTMTTNTRNHTLYETEKKYKHIMTESMKNKYVTENIIDKAKSNLFFYFSSVKDMKTVNRIFPVL